jgi:hypothetical protein
VMATRLICVCVVGVALLVVSPTRATACDCVTLPSSSPSYSGLIVRGRVIKLEHDQRTNTLAVELLVDEVLSGDHRSKTLTVYGHVFGESCFGYDFRIGREYIVFPRPNDTDQTDGNGVIAPPGALLFGMLCGPTTDLRTVHGQQKLKEIRAYFKTKENPTGVKQP